MPEIDELELDTLRNEVTQERQIVQMLQQSVTELNASVSELEKKLESSDEVSNCEWKTRYETQVEMKQLLEMQTAALNEKLEEARRTAKDGKVSKFPVELLQVSMWQATPENVQQLEQTKQGLESQLRDMQWRLEHEAKAHHKATIERKNCISEMNDVHGHAENLRSKSRNSLTPLTPRSSLGNIAQDQRVIDVRRGPIRKTAAVKTLPRID